MPQVARALGDPLAGGVSGNTEQVDAAAFETECVDWILVWNPRHLERVRTEYLRHYNTARPHRGVDLQVPVPWTQPPSAEVKELRRVERTDVLGGLIHEYRHAA